MDDCIFCKIARHEIPKEFAYEDENVMAFSDINPLKPIHLLIVPKQHVKDLLNVEDRFLFGKMCAVIQTLVLKNGLESKGYRVVVNGGGAQVIDHLHIHLMGPVGLRIKE